MKKIIKRIFAPILCVALIMSCMIFATPSASAADTLAGKYYIKIVFNVTDTCQGWNSSSIKFTYKSDNGTSTESTSDEFKSTADSVWNTKGEHTIFEGSYAGFPTGFTHDYSFGGGVTWRGLGYTAKIYVGTSSTNLKEVFSQDFSAKSSAFSAAKGTFKGTVDESKFPLPSTSVFSTAPTQIVIPRSDQPTANITYNASIKDQYGVAWYIAPTYSIDVAHEGVYFIDNILSVTQDAVSQNGANQTISVTASLRTATASVNVTLVNPSYKYTFLNATGGTLTSGTLKYGQQIPTPNNPSKVFDDTYHYTFSNWSSVPGIIKNDITFTPSFDRAEHQFNDYVSNGDASCLEDGTKTAVCTGCACTNTLPDTGSAMGHNYVGAVTTEPTCTENGVRTYTCEHCNDSYTEVILALGHDLSDWVVTTAPTCTENGVAEKTCSRCDYKESKTVEALGHDLSDWVITTAPTCTEKGVQTKTCSRCDYSETEEIPALGHSYSDWTVTKEASCTEKGIKTAVCDNCKESVTQFIPALGHSYGEWEVTTPATCTQDGSKTRTCTNCNDVQIETIPALGHDYELKSIAPDDSAIGYKYYFCESCNKYFACEMDEEGRLSVGNEANTLEDVKLITLNIPATEFNTYNRIESNYNYVNRCAALRLDDGSAANVQAMRFTSSMLIPNGAEVVDYGYVYTQADLLTTIGKFVIGGNNIENISLKDGNYSTFSTDKGTVKTFNLVINVTQPNWKTDYVARPYLTYSFAGDEYTVYDKCYSQRSVYGIASLIVASSTETQATKDFFQAKIIDALA